MKSKRDLQENIEEFKQITFKLNSKYMKKQLLMLVGLLAAFTGLLAQGNIHDLDFNVQRADVSVVDIDGDGDKDVLILGENPDGRFTQLFQNNGSMSFQKVESPITTIWVPSMDYGDINGDGQMDIIQSGFGDTVIVNIYTKDANGDLVLDDLYKELIHIAPSSGFSDLNNDGITDIFVFGNHNIEDQRAKIYYGKEDGTFESVSLFDSYKLIDSKVVDVDYDNDGDMDLWVMGGYEEGLDARFNRLFVNDGGAFTPKDLGNIAKGPGSSDWGDYDGDGDLDLLIGGWGYVNSGEDNDMVYRIYKNTDGVFAEAAVFQPYGQFGIGDGSRFADWDNDGDLDVILTGWNPDAGGQRTAFFMNNSGSFTLADYSGTVPGVSESALEVGDLDDDGDLDVVITGFSGNEWNGEGSAFGKNISVIIENTTATTNAAPSAPTNTMAVSSGKKATFSWDEAVDDKTPGKSLTYNLFLVNAEGKFYYYPLADTTSGKLIVQEKGNMQLNTSWVVKGLPYGEYRWGVQAIDNSFAGSVFATATFDHIEGGLAPLSQKFDDASKPLVYPNPGKGFVNVNISKDLASFVIYGLDGRLVHTQSVKKDEQSVRLNLEGGMYILKAQYYDGSRVSEKVIIQ
jgi:hypothetical protein